jgi:hypothetical protein
MKTREIYASSLKGVLQGLFAIGIGLWIMLSTDMSVGGFLESYFLPFISVVCLLVGFWMLFRPVGQRLMHRPYLRLTEEALEVSASFRKGYEHYPLDQINTIYESAMYGKNYMVIRMEEGFRPQCVNTSSFISKQRIKKMGSPYVFVCSVTPYSAYELLTWLNDYRNNARHKED